VPPAGDTWAIAEDYERYVGRWSRLVALRFLDWLAMPAGSRWADIGCGTGALSQLILRHDNPVRLIGIDPSAGFIAHAKTIVTDPRASFQLGDAQSLPLADASQDAVVGGLMLNFVPDMARAAAEMRRACRAGGCVAAYVWDYAAGMQLIHRFWHAAVALFPDAAEKDEAHRFPICQPIPLSQLFTQAGFADVQILAIEVPTRFVDFDDYWTPFLGGQGPAPAFCMSLPEQDRIALRETLRATLPTNADGSISLTARAWAVKGTVPR